MISIRAVPPGMHLMPDAATVNSGPSASSAASTFPTLAATQASAHAVPPAHTANTSTPLEQAANVLRQWHLQATIRQLLACRKTLLHAAGTCDAPVRRASVFDVVVSDCDAPDGPMTDSRGETEPACIDERSCVQSSESPRDAASLHRDQCRNDLGNVFSNACARYPSTATLVWSHGSFSWTPVAPGPAPRPSVPAAPRQLRKPLTSNSPRQERRWPEIEGDDWDAP